MGLVPVIALSKETGTETYYHMVKKTLHALIGCVFTLSACHALIAVLLVTVLRSVLHGSLLPQQFIWCCH